MSLLILILTNPPAVPHRILLHLRTQAKAILPKPTKRDLLPPIHLPISLPTKVKVQPNPTNPHISLRTSLRTNPLTKSPLNLTAVLLTDHAPRLRTNPIVNPPHHTGPNPTASLLPLTGPHLSLTENRHLRTNHPGAVLLLIRVRREVLPPGLALPGPDLRRARLRKKSKCATSCKAT